MHGKPGMDVSAHLLSFFKELQRDTGEEGDHRGGSGEAKSSHPQLASEAVPLGSVFFREEMLKFFSARDDENERLLGAVTEGKTAPAAAGWGCATSHPFAYVMGC